MFGANNYGYNPYGTYMQPRPMQQPIEQSPLTNGQNNMIPTNRPFLNGKQVDSLDVVKATDIGLDGNINYFPLTDGSAIITKQLQMDGTSKITIFKPFTEQKQESLYITREELESAFKSHKSTELEDLRDEVNAIKKDIKNLKKKGDVNE